MDESRVIHRNDACVCVCSTTDRKMMNERRCKLQTVKVDHYDGQSIYSRNELIYELGGYLGGGAAGVYVVLALFL